MLWVAPFHFCFIYLFILKPFLSRWIFCFKRIFFFARKHHFSCAERGMSRISYQPVEFPAQPAHRVFSCRALSCIYAACRDVWHCLVRSKQRTESKNTSFVFLCAQEVKLWLTAAAVFIMTFAYLTHNINPTSHQIRCILRTLRRRWFDVAEANCVCIR